ncbi:hypothetical protein A3E46_01760 [Candidatus Woesebacteria bacterium RIFCSPHIGHO2_12_FULL_46_16]|uniref:Uncharacterized protein n=1 Tax=Candidatus Woesebacteria bacterium RIFCSPHIGHO2_12_FULL_46_16 TaxID=1802513 RepID=A0A1F8AZ54_9BACT|nr:MAG: hypothetical protein A3E46_01760 [Candidatus Woesebacteria bacterium RIFCSPHIGHO2_12_FULL_46_16]
MSQERKRERSNKLVPVEGITGGYHFSNLEPLGLAAREKLIREIRRDVAHLEAEDKRTRAI